MYFYNLHGNRFTCHAYHTPPKPTHTHIAVTLSRTFLYLVRGIGHIFGISRSSLNFNSHTIVSIYQSNSANNVAYLSIKCQLMAIICQKVIPADSCRNIFCSIRVRMLLKKAYKVRSGVCGIRFFSPFLSLLLSLLYTIEICIFQISGIFYNRVPTQGLLRVHIVVSLCICRAFLTLISRKF